MQINNGRAAVAADQACCLWICVNTPRSNAGAST
jgi:hypothetical protein